MQTTVEELWSRFDYADGLLRLPILNGRKDLFRCSARLDFQKEVPVPGDPREDPQDPDLDVGGLRGREHQEDVFHRLFEREILHPLAGDPYGDDRMFQILNARVGERDPLVEER